MSRIKILDLNACHILPPQIQLSEGFELKIQNFILASFLLEGLKRFNFKAYINHSDHSLRFLYSRHPCVASEVERNLIWLLPHTSLKNHFCSMESQHFSGQFMTADDSIKWWCTCLDIKGQKGGFQNPGVCLQVFPFYLRHF